MTQNQALLTIGTELDKGNQARQLVREILLILQAEENEQFIHPKIQECAVGWHARFNTIGLPGMEEQQ